jgi:two-component system, NtrC family, sensor histidine kinase HydH
MSQSISLQANKWLNKIVNGDFVNGLRINFMPKSKTIPWFSLVGLTSATLFCVAFGSILSHFMIREILNHDVVITKEFINSVEWVETQEAQLGKKISFGQLLDERTDLKKFGVSEATAAGARRQYYDHISTILDVKIATVFARDRTVIWSTDPANIGTVISDSEDLETAFNKGEMVWNDSFSGEKLPTKYEKFITAGAPFVQSLIPMRDINGEVVAMVEVYQEPHNLAQTIHQGKLLIWFCIALGAIFLYAMPYFLFRRADGELQDKQERLSEAETLCVIGEMSTAVAHGIRNPLAAIRSSAELAIDADPESARKNAEDIISQVDRLSKWVREFLTFSLPVAGESEVLDVASLIETSMQNFATQFKNNHIAYQLVQPTEDVPLIIGNKILANQALSSLVSNAIEAMPSGGLLQVKIEVSTAANCVDVTVVDSGIGMSATQIQMAFKPFYTTKRNGIGLGMAQVKRIMERFGGLVSLHSREGEGTQASLSFRVA